MWSPTFNGLIEKVPWFYVTILSNTFIYLLELYLDMRQGLRLRSYGLRKNIVPMNYARFESTVGFIFECLVLIFGLLVWSWDFTSAKLQSFGYGNDYPIVRGVTYLFLISFFSSLVRAPSEVFRVVILDPPIGSRWRTILRMAADQMSIFILSFVVGVPLLAATLSLLYWDLPFQWLLTCLFVCTVAILMSDLYGFILGPLFNRYTELEEGELKKEIMQLSQKLNFPLKGVYTMDGSKRSAHSNAFLMGFWNTSVVLYDTLIKQLDTPEILAILGHEIGHHKLRHIWKHLCTELVFIGNFIFLFSRVVNLPSFYVSFGFSRPDAAIGLVLFSYLYSTFANFLRFVTNLVRRRFEYAADAYAISQGLHVREALIKMHGAVTVSHALPDPLYSLYYFAHPPLSERIVWIDHFVTVKKQA